MSKKRVEIPVQVTGSKEAKSDLRSVANEVKNLGEAGFSSAKGVSAATGATDQNAAAHGKAAPAINKTKKATEGFDDAAKTAAVGILGQFSPGLASLANLAADVAKGFKGVTLSLLGIMGAGVAIGGFLLLFNKMIEKAQELKDALERARVAKQKLAEGQREPYEQISEALRTAGGYSQANATDAYRKQFLGAMEAGVPQEAAAKLAGVGFLARLSADDLALLYAAGIEPQTPDEARKAIDRIRRNPQTLAEVQRQADEWKRGPIGARTAASAMELRDKMKSDPQFTELAQGASQDAIILAELKKRGILEDTATLEDVDRIRGEIRDAKRNLEWIDALYSGKTGLPPPPPGSAEGYRKLWQNKIDSYGPFPDLEASLRAQGIYDTTGELRDYQMRGAPSIDGPPRPMGFSPETQRALGTTNNTYIGQLHVYDANGIIQRPLEPILGLEGGRD